MATKRKPKNKGQKDAEPIIRVTVANSGVTTAMDSKAKRIYVSVNAFVFAVNQVEFRFKSLESLLMEFDSTKNNLGSRQFSIDIGYKKRNEIVSLAWDIVDWLERARKIFGVISGIPKNNNHYSSIMKLLEPAERFRQILQHYDSEVIKRAVEGMYPVMGGVIATFRRGESWYGRILLSTPARFPGDKEVNIAGVKFIKDNMQGDIDGITLSVTSHAINLSEILCKLKLEKIKLSTYLEQTFDFHWPKR